MIRRAPCHTPRHFPRHALTLALLSALPFVWPALATAAPLAQPGAPLSLAPDAPAPAAPAAAPAPSAALFKKITLSDKFYCEGADFGDFNQDGQMDLVSGPYWYEGPDFTRKHEIYSAKAVDPHGYSDNFLTYVYDFNGDGAPDVLVVGFPGKEAIWYENPGKEGVTQDRPWKKHVVQFKVGGQVKNSSVDNESPIFVDVDGDGKPDLLCMSGGQIGYATVDWGDATRPWTWHGVCKPRGDYQRFTHGIGYGDVNGDGKTDLLAADGWYEQPAQDAGSSEWKFHKFTFANGPHGHGGAQMYAYDVDGDGKNDVITGDDAHGYGLQWWRNLGPDSKGEIQFEKHVILGPKTTDNPYGVKFSQLHALALVDVDGDGLKDLVTGKRFWAHGPGGDAEPAAPAVLYWFRLVRGPGGTEFVPYLVDDNSGVGTQITAGGTDATHPLPNIVVGNKKGTFVFISQIGATGKGALEKLKPARAEGAAAGAGAAGREHRPGEEMLIDGAKK